MILDIEAEDKTGKTTLAYTAPLPIVGFSFDMGTERAIYGTQYDKYFKDLKIKIIPPAEHKYNIQAQWDGNDITVYEIPQPIQLSSEKLEGFIKTWDFFIGLCGLAAQSCQMGEVSTVVVDTMTLARRIKADAYLQELQENSPNRPRKQLLQIEYGHANDSIRNIYTLFAGLRANLVAIHHLMDERRDVLDKDGTVQSMVTGERILEGLAQTYRYIDVGVRMEVNKGKPVGTMIKCGYNLDLEGQRLTNPSWDTITDLISMSLGERLKFQRRNHVTDR